MCVGVHASGVSPWADLSTDTLRWEALRHRHLITDAAQPPSTEREALYQNPQKAAYVSSILRHHRCTPHTKAVVESYLLWKVTLFWATHGEIPT